MLFKFAFLFVLINAWFIFKYFSIFYTFIAVFALFIQKLLNFKAKTHKKLQKASIFE